MKDWARSWNVPPNCSESLSSQLLSWMSVSRCSYCAQSWHMDYAGSSSGFLVCFLGWWEYLQEIRHGFFVSFLGREICIVSPAASAWLSEITYFPVYITFSRILPVTGLITINQARIHLFVEYSDIHSWKLKAAKESLCRSKNHHSDNFCLLLLFFSANLMGIF